MYPNPLAPMLNVRRMCMYATFPMRPTPKRKERPKVHIVHAAHLCTPHAPQNFSIKFFLTVHILPRLPQIYTGIVVSRQAN